MPAYGNANAEPLMDELVFPGWELLVGGALLATARWRHPLARGLAVGAGGLGAFVLARRWVASRGGGARRSGVETGRAERDAAKHPDPFEVVEITREEEPFDLVEHASEESFPASDPPGFVGGSNWRPRAQPEPDSHPLDPSRDGPEDEWSPESGARNPQ